MADLDAFRAETRAWLEANCPPEMREPVQGEEDVYWGGRRATFKSDAQKAWFEACSDKGYTVPSWPKEYGGAGLSPAEAKILREEMARISARPPLSSFGIWMLGPALLHFGTEGQKKHFLNQIARGEIRWCQGYSEPGSGSDLVSLQTFGDDQGDHWVVNGQKIWTSYADKADWIFCLVRTDKANKYQGITFMLFDMESAGVSTKPILLISGNSRHEIISHSAERLDAPIAELDDFVYEPDNAVVRSHLIGQLAEQIEAHLFAPEIAYLTSDKEITSPWLKGYRVIDNLVFDRKKLKAYLRERGIGVLEIKKRGSDIVPEQLRRELALKGEGAATLIVTRVGDAHRVLVTQPISH